MTAPEVSVLLPAYNAERWLDTCLRSLARQRGVAFEVVAVDDGSSDATGPILKEWGQRGLPVRVETTDHRGLVAALNRGLESCRGAFIARMDADDACHPDRLRLQRDLLRERPEVGVVACRIRCVPRSRVAGGFRLFEDWVNSLVSHEAMARERFVDVPVVHPSVMVRREVLGTCGGWRALGWAEDHDLWLRLFAAGVVFHKLPETLLFWRDHPDRLTRRDAAYAKQQFLDLKAHHLVRGPLARADRVVVWGAGPTGLRLMRALAAEGRRVDALVDIDPAKIGGARSGVPVLDGLDPDSWLVEPTVVLAAVASRGARGLIRRRLEELGLEEGRDFWCVA